MALSAGISTKYYNPENQSKNTIGTTLSVAVWEGGFYAVDTATGLVVVPAVNAAYRGIGFAYKNYMSGSTSSVYIRGDEIEILISGGVAVTAFGAAVHAEDDNTFTLTTTDRPRVGYISRILNTTTGRVRVRIDPA